jgi:Flp pilus assembly protein TadD
MLQFDAALELEPRRADTLYYAGRVWLTMGEAKRALDALNKATALKPDDAWAWNALGAAYSLEGDAAKASSAVQRALSLEPANELFQQNRTCVSKALNGCRLIH